MRFINPPFMWFLDEDPHLSARYLIDKDLKRNINVSSNVLINVYLYINGIRSDRMLQYYESDQIRYYDFMEKVFPNWPLKRKPKVFRQYHPGFKFSRKCLDNFNFIKSHFDAGLDEYENRFNKSSILNELSEWIDEHPPKLPLINLSKITLPLKVLPLQYRSINHIDGARKFYKRLIVDPLVSYHNIEIPEWFFEKNSLH